MEFDINTILIVITSLAGLFIFINSGRRTAQDVLDDLHIEDLKSEEVEIDAFEDKKKQKKDEYRQMGLIDKQAIKNFELKLKLIPIGFVISSLFIRILSGNTSIKGLLLTMLFSFAAGVLYTARLKNKYKEKYKYEMNFFLPLTMERLVMAVQAGQDILPAIGVILDVEKNKQASKIDPICQLLSQVKDLSDAGLSFDKSLYQVAESIDNGALRHAFIHLALAHKEGGELVTPLRELSDSTQIFYQETVEEEIAKLPVKATMPLLLTFAGLIICFITSPIIQIIEIMQKAAP